MNGKAVLSLYSLHSHRITFYALWEMTGLLSFALIKDDLKEDNRVSHEKQTALSLR